MPYNLPTDYVPRLEPKYFDDVLADAHLWQADVYRAAALLARRTRATHLVDIGCGRATKLMTYESQFHLVGIDYGANIDHLQAHHSDVGAWHKYNLESEIVPVELFEHSVTICADVIEHLIDPTALIQSLKNAVESAAYVLVSTPDRHRLQQGTEKGPPANPAHVREWTQKELTAWFEAEGLPVKWSGWTVSFDNQPDRVNTILIVLSAHFAEPELPITYQPAHSTRFSAPSVQGEPLKVWMTPTPNEAGRDITNAINQIVVRVNKYLPEFGVQLVEEPDNATIHAGHAGQGSQAPIHVAHFHGLYPTAQGSDVYAVNAAVIRNLKTALVITAPSQWIADVIRRDMHVEPRIIGWGVDTQEWTPSESYSSYAIWAKARVDNVSNPKPMLDLAARAHDQLFLTTFGEGTPNVKTIGRQPYEVMKQYVRNAAVYLSTNVETFGIGLMEAMSAGVPILTFRQGAQADYIVHGYNGFMAEPGDMEGLYKGLQYCLEHRERLGANARETAKQYTWRKVAQRFAEIYHEVAKMKDEMPPMQIDQNLYKY